MDIAPFGDPGTARGISILQGPAFAHRDSLAAEREASPRSPASGGSPKSGSPKSKSAGRDKRKASPPPGRSSGGLDIGRRQCLVLQIGEGGEGGEESDDDTEHDGSSPRDIQDRLPPSKGDLCRIIDHGDNQKEAIRRLFDAQVLLKSYEEQLTYRENEAKALEKKLKEVANMKARTLATGQELVLERNPNEGDEKRLVYQSRDVAGGAPTAVDPAKRQVPDWLKSDERSRKSIELMKASLMKEYMVEGHLDARKLVDHFWMVGMDFALRWGGNPDEELIKSAQKEQDRSRRVQRDALKETTMLRQHLKKLEKKYKELQEQLKAMSGMPTKQVNKDAPDGASRAKATGGRGGGGGGGGGGASVAGGSGGSAYASPSGAASAASGGVAQAARAEGVATGAAAASAGGAPGVAAGAPGRTADESSGRTGGVPAAGAGGAAAGGRAAGGRAAGSGAPGTASGAAAAGGAFAAGGAPGAAGGVASTAGSAAGAGGGVASGSHAGGPAGGYGAPAAAGGGYGAPAVAGSRGAVVGGVGRGARAAGGHAFGGPSVFDHVSVQGSGGGGGPILPHLADDETLMVAPSHEELDALDSEIFEPLLSLDEDMRELCIDVVNEKVRRILASNPDNFKNGRLPFGLRPDKLEGDEYQRILQLEGELDQLKSDHLDLKEANQDLVDQLEAAKRNIENLKQGKKEKPIAQPQPQEQHSRRQQPQPQETSPAPTPTSRRDRVQQEDPPAVKDDAPQGSGGAPIGMPPAAVAKTVREAVEKANKEASEKMKKLEQEMKKAQADAEAKLQADLKAAEKAAEQKLKEAEKKLEKAEAALAEAEKGNKGNKGTKAPVAEKETKEKKVKEKKAEEPEPQKEPPPRGKTPDPVTVEKVVVKDPNPELEKELFVAKANEKRLMQQLKELQESMNAEDLVQQAVTRSQSSHQQSLQKFAELAEDKEKASRTCSSAEELEDLSAEIHQSMSKKMADLQEQLAAKPKTILKEVVKEAAPVAAAAPPEVKTIVKEVIKANPEDAQEIMRLNKKINGQSEEISRLLITIDELRARIESVKDMATELPPEVASVVRGTMKKAGLKEIMEASTGPKLKGVFERLYQDSIQRMQRLGLIRERMLLANKAYSNVVSAMVAKGEDGKPALHSVPDLDRLSDTAAAALSGMWYHTDFLFRNTCEYAIAQGVESSIMKGQKVSLFEVIDAANTDRDGSLSRGPRDNDPNSPDFKARRRQGDRLPCRQGSRGEILPGATTGGDGRAFWNPYPGGLKSPKSPRELRKERLADPAPTPFCSYIAALREARGDLKADEWPRATLPEKNVHGSRDGVEFAPKTLKASVSVNSRSLPVLPRGRGLTGQPSDVTWEA